LLHRNKNDVLARAARAKRVMRRRSALNYNNLIKYAGISDERRPQRFPWYVIRLAANFGETARAVNGAVTAFP
jgi:hypothetical protein